MPPPIAHLLAAHFSARWGWRAWEFAVALVVMGLCPTTFSLVSAYGLLDSSARVIFGAPIGRWIDRTPRLRAVLILTVAQHGLVAISCTLLLLLLHQSSHANTDPSLSSSNACGSSRLSLAIMGISMVTAALGGAANESMAVALQRTWPKLLSGGDSDKLAVLNVRMRGLDMACQLLSPMAVGFLMARTSMIFGSGALLLFTILTLPLEMLLLSAVHASSAALQQPPAKLLALDDDECCGLTGGGEGGGGGGGSGGRDQADCEAESGGHLLGSEASDDAGDDAAALAASASAFASRARGPKASKTSPLARRVRRWTRPLQVFYRQKVFVPMVSYAFLYITVLSMGFLMTSYVQWAGLPLDQISIFRGFGAASGFIATGIFPFLHRRIGLIMTGVLQLLIGLVLSRTGVWVFDLSLSQLMQEEVPVEELGTVSGVHNAISAALGTSMYVAGLVLHRPEEFGLLLFISLLAVSASAVTYWMWALPEQRRRRGVDSLAGAESSGLGLALLGNRAGERASDEGADPLEEEEEGEGRGCGFVGVGFAQRRATARAAEAGESFRPPLLDPEERLGLLLPPPLPQPEPQGARRAVTR